NHARIVALSLYYQSSASFGSCLPFTPGSARNTWRSGSCLKKPVTMALNAGEAEFGRSGQLRKSFAPRLPSSADSGWANGRCCPREVECKGPCLIPSSSNQKVRPALLLGNRIEFGELPCCGRLTVVCG